MQFLAYFLCTLSALDALMNLLVIINWGCHGDWAAFTLAVIAMSLVSCVTSLVGAVGDHQSSSSADRASECAPAPPRPLRPCTPSAGRFCTNSPHLDSLAFVPSLVS